VIQCTTRAARRRPRGIPGTLATTAFVLCLWAVHACAQTREPFTIDPAMTRGPAAAPVTIVEFSDYQ
jgi:hypothetical protein